MRGSGDTGAVESDVRSGEKDKASVGEGDAKVVDASSGSLHGDLTVLIAKQGIQDGGFPS